MAEIRALWMLVVCLFASVVYCSAASCDVGETEDVVEGGLCNSARKERMILKPVHPNQPPNEAACKEYCKQKHGAELIDATCSEERPSGKRECICKLKCCSSGCWGDPHCWTCDGAKFGYQGLKKHYMLKPSVVDFETLPYFEIRQKNKVYQRGPMAVIDTSEVIIRDWRMDIELKVPEGGGKNDYKLKINHKPQSIPFVTSKFDDFRQYYVNITYLDQAKSVVQLQTSFGLRIVYSTHVRGAITYSDIAVEFPRHAELKNKTEGLLGRWNDNVADESIDSKGVKRPLDEKFSWDFGDSWIVDGSTVSERERAEAKRKYEQQLNAMKPAERESLQKLCRDNLETPELLTCAKTLGRSPPGVQDCITDLLEVKDECGRKQYLSELLETFATSCKNPKLIVLEKKEAPKCDLAGSLTPLYRLYSTPTDDHFYTVSYDETTNSIKRNGFVSEGITGNVAMNPKDCTCNETGFQPTYRLFKSAGGKGDNHFYTTNDQEAENAARRLGYKREGVAFYCSMTKDHCGASVALHRYFRGTDHFYTTDTNEVKKLGGRYEGILCHIWPNSQSVRQDTRRKN